MPMKGTVAAILLKFLVLWASISPLMAQTSGNEQQQPEFIKQGQQLLHAGKLDEALALYRQTLQLSPDSFPANIAAGTVLDLMGNARKPASLLRRQSKSRERLNTRQWRKERWRCRLPSREIARRPYSTNSGLQLLRQREQILSAG